MVAATHPALASAVLDLVHASTRSDPLNTLADVLSTYVQRFHSMGSLLQEALEDEILLHVSPSLTIYHITLSPGIQYPPHNHLMDALVGIYKGSEMNFIYSPERGGGVAAATRQHVRAPSVIHMDANTVHAVANIGSGRSGALHVYLGDLPGTRRQLWAADGLPPEAFDDARYLAGARPIEFDSNLTERRLHDRQAHEGA
jgi:predicted metal-dependent enzyme (double-stranded beta helix superfamily)